MNWLDRFLGPAAVNIVLNFWLQYNLGNFCITEKLSVSQYGLCYMKKISYYLHERWSQTSTRQDGRVTSECKLKKETLLIENMLEIRRGIFSLWVPYSTSSPGNVPKQFNHLQWTIPNQRRRLYKVVTKLQEGMLVEFPLKTSLQSISSTTRPNKRNSTYHLNLLRQIFHSLIVQLGIIEAGSVPYGIPTYFVWRNRLREMPAIHN